MIGTETVGPYYSERSVNDITKRMIIGTIRRKPLVISPQSFTKDLKCLRKDLRIRLKLSAL